MSDKTALVDIGGGVWVEQKVVDFGDGSFGVKVVAVNADGTPITGATTTGIGNPTDLEAPDDGSVIALLKRLRTLLGGVLSVGGAVASGQPASGNPVPIAGRVSTSLPSAEINGDQVTVWIDEYGRLQIVQSVLQASDGDNVGLAAFATTNGLSSFRSESQLATAVAVKAAAGKLHRWHVVNRSGADIWLHFYNKAQGTTAVGTDTPQKSWLVPNNSLLDDSSDLGIWFSTAITIAATTSHDHTVSTAPGTGLVVNLDYV